MTTDSNNLNTEQNRESLFHAIQYDKVPYNVHKTRQKINKKNKVLTLIV